jgi:hypothetical protein
LVFWAVSIPAKTRLLSGARHIFCLILRKRVNAVSKDEPLVSASEYTAIIETDLKVSSA